MAAIPCAPVYPEPDLDDPTMRQVMVALGHLLERHAPYPAVVMDRRWDVVEVNTGAAHLFADLCPPEPVRNRRMCCG
jgi:MmyB-like transcription regulator ligand binding domain